MIPEPGTTRRAAPPRRRVFFALKPDRATAAVLARVAQSLLQERPGRAVPPGNLHLTLAFLGGVDAAALRRARQVPPVPAGPLRLQLDRVGYFKRTRTLWLGPTSVPEALQSLEAQLWAGLTAAGFERERRAFRPHVTIARHSAAARGSIDAVSWNVDTLTLMESVPADSGVRYRALQRWPL